MMTCLCLSNPGLNWCFLSALQAHKGLRGVVRDRSGKPIAGAIIILNGGVRVFTATGGYFRALLAPGNHVFEVVADGYQQQRQEVEQRCFKLQPHAVWQSLACVLLTGSRLSDE